MKQQIAPPSAGPGARFQSNPGRFRPRPLAPSPGQPPKITHEWGPPAVGLGAPDALAPRGALPPSASASSETTWRGFRLFAGDAPTEAPNEAAGPPPPVCRRAFRGARVFGCAAWAQAAEWPGAGRQCTLWERGAVRPTGAAAGRSREGTEWNYTELRVVGQMTTAQWGPNVTGHIKNVPV